VKRGYSARIVEKVIGANFVAVFNDVWTVVRTAKYPDRKISIAAQITIHLTWKMLL
jgi:hypothetical protein